VKKVLIQEVGTTPPLTPSLPHSTSTSEAPKVIPVPDEGPSLLEQMMAAQHQAKKADDVVKAKLKAKEDKKALGGGFKKGDYLLHHSLTHSLTTSLTYSLHHYITTSLIVFLLNLGFFGGSSTKTKKTASSSTTTTTTTTATTTTAKPTGSATEEHIPTIKAKQSSGKSAKGVVLDDVQRALKEEEERNPILQQLKGGGRVGHGCSDAVMQ
jgi:hypothetical protein